MFMWISAEYGRFRTKELSIHIWWRQQVDYNDTWHMYRKFGLYTKKKNLPKLQKSEEILEIRKKLKFSNSEFRKNRFDSFAKSI